MSFPWERVQGMEEALGDLYPWSVKSVMRLPKSLLSSQVDSAHPASSFLSWPKSPVKQGTCGPWRGLLRPPTPLRSVHIPSGTMAASPQICRQGCWIPSSLCLDTWPSSQDLLHKISIFHFPLIRAAVRMQLKLNNCLSLCSNDGVMVFHSGCQS